MRRIYSEGVLGCFAFRICGSGWSGDPKTLTSSLPPRYEPPVSRIQKLTPAIVSPLSSSPVCIFEMYLNTLLFHILRPNLRVSTFLFIIAWNHNSNFNWRKKNNLKKKKKEERHSRRIIVWNFRWYCRFIESLKYLRAVKWQRDFGYR